MHIKPGQINHVIKRFLILNQLKLWCVDIRFYVTVFLMAHIFILRVSLGHEGEEHDPQDAGVPSSVLYSFIQDPCA